MGHMKNFDIRIRMGGDDAIAAACEMRREACRQWLMRQCELEAHRGTNIELRRLSKIYRDNFGGEYGDDSGYNRDLPPYEWADAMLLERVAVACEPTEPTKPTLTNDERAAVEAILSDPDLVLGDTREPLRCLLERLSHHFPDAGNMVKNTAETRKNRGMA